MSLTIRRPKHGYVPEQRTEQTPAPSELQQRLDQAEADVQLWKGRAITEQQAGRVWQTRALIAEDTLRNLPAQVAHPHNLIVRLVAERDTALHLARRYRAAWTSARRRALPALPTTEPETEGQ